MSLPCFVYSDRLRARIQPVVVAGGRGLRMGAFTQDMPKPMLPIEGKPLLEHQLLWLKSQGFSDVILLLGYKAGAIKSYFHEGAALGMRLSYVVEEEPRGTAGAVKDAARLWDEDALIVYGDLFIDMDLSKFLKFHEADPKAAATLVVWESDHPLDSDLARMKGDRIEGFYRAKAGDKFENLALAAMWAVRKPLLDLIPADKPSDFGRDVFPAAAAKGVLLRGYKTGETLADLGTPERVEAFKAARGRA